jgi:hypothetical protein
VPRFITVSKVPVDFTLPVGFLYVGTVKKMKGKRKSKAKGWQKDWWIIVAWIIGSKQQHRGDINSADSALGATATKRTQ